MEVEGPVPARLDEGSWSKVEAMGEGIFTVAAMTVVFVPCSERLLDGRRCR